MLQNWLKTAFASARKKSLYTFINILGLTLGLTGFILVLLYINYETGYEKWNDQYQQIYRLSKQFGDQQAPSTEPPVGPAAKAQIPGIEDYLRINKFGERLLVYNNNDFYSKKIVEADPNFFEFFPFEFVYGSKTSVLTNTNSIAISDKLSKRLFGNENPTGKIIKWNNSEPLEVTAVYKTKNIASHFVPEAVTHINFGSKEGDWTASYLYTYLKLAKDADAETVLNTLNREYKELTTSVFAKSFEITVEEVKAMFEKLSLHLEPIADIHLHYNSEYNFQPGGNSKILWIISLLSLLIMVISCINYINLTMAGAAGRAKEVGIRKVLGGTDISIVKQSVFEIALQCVIALALSVTIAEILLPSYNNLVDKNLSLYGNWTLIPQLLLALLLVLFIAGFIPALYLAKFDPVKVLKGDFTRGKEGKWIQKSMVVLQFSISTIFIIGASIIYNQVNFMNTKDLGFNGEQVMVASIHKTKEVNKRFYDIKKLLEVQTGVVSVTRSASVPGGIFSGGNFAYQGNNYLINYAGVDFDYFETLSIPLKEGRFFNPQITSDSTHAVILNEKAVKLMGMKNPLGKRIKGCFNNSDDYASVIGVIKDYHHQGFDTEITPVIYMISGNCAQLPDQMLIKIASANIPGTVAGLQDFWMRRVETDFPMQYHFLDKEFAKLFLEYQKLEQFFIILTLVILLIAFMGLFAVASYMIKLRNKETAIRKVLGASSGELVFNLVKEFIKMSVIAVTIAIPISWLLADDWLQSFAYRILLPVLPFIFIPILIIVLVIHMVGLQSYRAINLDLINHLKSE
jgi:putative ABC transport system permease protein